MIEIGLKKQLNICGRKEGFFRTNILLILLILEELNK
jgi:hypothetical protein